MNRQNLAKWVREFKDGRTSIHDEDRSVRPTAVTDEFIVKVNGRVQADRWLLMNYTICALKCRKHKTITERLSYRKLCSLGAENVNW